MKQFKRAKVVMLSTNEKAQGDIRISLLTGSLLYKDNTATACNVQHLYIISDDEIKENNWCIDIEDNILFQVKEQGHSGLLRSATDSFVEDVCKKIIATTDNTLTIGMTKGNVYYISVPQPSQQFIEKYIESYNKGEVITDVLVEYEGYKVNGLIDEATSYSLKVNPKDNTITIKKVKDTWNKEDVHNLMMQAWINGESKPNLHYTVRENWIEETLNN